MHAQGAASWFSDGWQERETILRMGEPWEGLNVLEIGCGEGDLGSMIAGAGASYLGVDYSPEAIIRATSKYPDLSFWPQAYRQVDRLFDRVVMQGVIEHLDIPFAELNWMIERFKPKTVITSSPCFLNPRGIVWMTLNMLGAVMSKTDLHFLDPEDFQKFCGRRHYRLNMEPCDGSWGNGKKMIEDLATRIPLALKDGNIPFNPNKVKRFLAWLNECDVVGLGATMVYRIDI
jgi:SAM-dependent methyltransferase